MPVMASRVRPYRMPLRRPWRDRGRELRERRGWLLQLRDGAGRSGWGDCAPLSGPADAALGERLHHQAAALVGRDPARPPAPGAADGAVHCALETALLDLQGQGAGRSLHALLAPGSSPDVTLNATCGGLDAASGARLRAAARTGFRVFKFKLGLLPWEIEAARLRALAPDLPAGGRLRLDANRAWGFEEARRVVADLQGLPVESLEEPLAEPRIAHLARLQAEAPFSIALDESLWEGPKPSDLSPLQGGAKRIATCPDRVGDGSCQGFLRGPGTAPLWTAPPVRRLVLKPGPLGGPRRTLEIARAFAAQGGEVVVTHALESAPGLLLAMHTAAAVGGDLAHGLDPGPWMPEAQAALLPPVRDGRIRLPDRPGLGIDPEEALP